MKRIRIGGVELSGAPKVVAVITKKLSKSNILKIKKAGADILEVRVDCIQNASPDEIIKMIKEIKKIRLPVICTIRKDDWEKKHRRSSEKRRLYYFMKLLPYVDAVDIESEAHEIGEKVISIARKAKKTVIFSCHDFKKIPAQKILIKIFNDFKKSGADILKIAGYSRDIDEAMRFMAFIKKVSKSVAVIGIAMGRAGEFSRIYGGLFGSCMTYAHTGKKVAPGQIPLWGLKKKIHEIYQ